MPKLDRSKWHSPLATVIITHHDYSDHVEEALLSILDQSHANWECVIVDDASAPAHRIQLAAIIARFDSPKIRLIQNERNIGQIASFYVGVDNSKGDFITLLDPDDRYAGSFLKETIDAHLDDTFLCPQVSTDQYSLTERGLTTATYMGHLALGRAELAGTNLRAFIKAAPPPRIFFPPWWNNWFWSSTSAIVFRRPVLKYLRPHRQLAYRRAADAYLASGAHMLGGTLLLPTPLVYRTVHDRNAFITADMFSMNQSKQRAGAEQWYLTCRRDVVEAMFHNGVRNIFDDAFLAAMLKGHFAEDDMEQLRAACTDVAQLVPAPAAPPPPASLPVPADQPVSAHTSFLARGWRRLRKSGARRVASALKRLRMSPG